MTATYSINGENVDYDKLKTIKINRTDYIEYMEEIKDKIKGNTNQIQKVS